MFTDKWGDPKNFLLACKQHGYDIDVISDDLSYLDRLAKEMIDDNSAKPLFIVNNQDEIIRQYAVPFVNWRAGAHNKLFKFDVN